MKNKPTPRPNRPQAVRPAPARVAAPAPAAVAAKPGVPLLQSRWMIALVAVFSFLLYSNTLKHDYANDDIASVAENQVILKGWEQLGDVLTKANWYGYGQQNHSILRPFTGFTFATEIEFYGRDPHVQHFTNVALYAACCVVLFLVMRRLVSHIHPLLPLAVTLLFAAHPVHTEVVANIKSRDEILSFLFGLALPLYLLLRYLNSGKALHLGLAMLCYFLGVFSKESAVTFVAVFPLTLFFFTQLPLRRIATLSAPFVLPVALLLLARYVWLDPAPANYRPVIDNVVFGATTLHEKLATISVIMLEYVRLLVFPHPLSWDYSYNHIPVASFANAKALLSVALHLGLLVVGIMGLRKKRIWSYCILFYFITMSVYSNLLVPIHATVGERFLFSPSVAFCLLLGYGAFLLQRALRKEDGALKPAFFSYAMVAVALVTTLYSFKTVARNKDWRDSVTISKAGVEVAPNSARARSAYGSSLMQMGERSPDPNAKPAYYREGLAQTKKALEIYPNEVNYVYNAGVLSFYLEDTASARRYFTRAIELEPTKLNALYNLAATYEKMGNNRMALKYFERVQAIDSMFQNVTYSAGNAAIKLKDYPRAERNMRAFLRKKPTDGDAYNVLGVVYYEQQKLPEAANYFSKAVQLAPNRADFYANAGSVYYMMQDYQKAAQYYELALRYQPGNPTYASYLQASKQLSGQR